MGFAKYADKLRLIESMLPRRGHTYQPVPPPIFGRCSPRFRQALGELLCRLLDSSFSRRPALFGVPNDGFHVQSYKIIKGCFCPDFELLIQGFPAPFFLALEIMSHQIPDVFTGGLVNSARPGSVLDKPVQRTCESNVNALSQDVIPRNISVENTKCPRKCQVCGTVCGTNLWTFSVGIPRNAPPNFSVPIHCNPRALVKGMLPTTPPNQAQLPNRQRA